MFYKQKRKCGVWLGVFTETVIQTEFLFSRLAEEKKTGELLPLPASFYREVEETIKKHDKTGTPAEQQNKQTILNLLKAKRTQKILIYIAYGKQIPVQLPSEEEALYYQILKILNKEANIPRTTKIKILINIPEIITTQGNKIGPYQEGEVIQMEDSGDAEFIINNKIGEIIS